jgi:hypothetical protein
MFCFTLSLNDFVRASGLEHSGAPEMFYQYIRARWWGQRSYHKFWCHSFRSLLSPLESYF